MFEEISHFTKSGKGLIFILCLSAFLKIILFTASSGKAINPDGVLYITAAQHIYAGNFKEAINIYSMPCYSIMIAVVYLFIHNWIIAGKIISLISLVLTLIPLYLLINLNFDRRSAFWGCMAFALAPFSNGFVYDIVRGPPFLFFFAWAVYFAQCAIIYKKAHFFFLTSCLFCFLIFLRIESIILIPVFFLFIIYLLISSSKKSFFFSKRLFVATIIPLLIFLLSYLFLVLQYESFNRSDYIVQEIKSLTNCQFLDNYHKIYNQLKEMEKSALYPNGKQNFVEIARHFMPIIYFLGLLEIYLKVIFPLFIIPLFINPVNIFKKSSILILFFIVSYIIMIYYSLIKQDFIQSRFFIAPALLLYPFIGKGITQMLAISRQSSKPVLFTILFIILFYVPPVLKNAGSIERSKSVIIEAGEWIAQNAELKDCKMITNDIRIPFYAGKKTNYSLFNLTTTDVAAREHEYVSKKVDIIVIRTSHRKKQLIPDLKHYKIAKKNIGEKKTAVIFFSDDFSKKITKPLSNKNS